MRGCADRPSVPDDRSHGKSHEGVDHEGVDPEVERVKLQLRRLAGPTDLEIVERADAAVDDLAAAADFVDEVGLERLELAVDGVEDDAVRERGERALAAFRRFRRAAAGEAAREGPRSDGSDTGESTDGEYFHHGRDTDLRGDAEGQPR